MVIVFHYYLICRLWCRYFETSWWKTKAMSTEGWVVTMKEIQPIHTGGDCIPLLLDMQVVMQILGTLLDGRHNQRLRKVGKWRMELLLILMKWASVMVFILHTGSKGNHYTLKGSKGDQAIYIKCQRFSRVGPGSIYELVHEGWAMELLLILVKWGRIN